MKRKFILVTAVFLFLGFVSVSHASTAKSFFNFDSSKIKSKQAEFLSKSKVSDLKSKFADNSKKQADFKTTSLDSQKKRETQAVENAIEKIDHTQKHMEMIVKARSLSSRASRHPQSVSPDLSDKLSSLNDLKEKMESDTTSADLETDLEALSDIIAPAKQ